MPTPLGWDGAGQDRVGVGPAREGLQCLSRAGQRFLILTAHCSDLGSTWENPCPCISTGPWPPWSRTSPSGVTCHRLQLIPELGPSQHGRHLETKRAVGTVSPGTRRAIIAVISNFPQKSNSHTIYQILQVYSSLQGGENIIWH